MVEIRFVPFSITIVVRKENGLEKNGFESCD